jgi:hypothetical protein
MKLPSRPIEEDPFSLFDAYDSYVFGGYLFGFGVAGILLLRDAVPEIGSRLSGFMNVGVGIGLYFAYSAIYRSIARSVYDTWFFEPYVMLAFATFPLLYFVVTPWATSRILRATKPAQGDA